MATKTKYTAVQAVNDGKSYCHLCSHGRKPKYTCPQEWTLGKIKPSNDGHLYHPKCAVKVCTRMNEQSITEAQAIQMFTDEHKLACTPEQFRGRVQRKDGDGDIVLG